jgi:hypothetical protein
MFSLGVASAIERAGLSPRSAVAVASNSAHCSKRRDPFLRTLALLLGIAAASRARAGSPFQPPAAEVPQVTNAEMVGAQLVIQGLNLGTAATPVVLLGGTPLTVQPGYTSSNIVASLPPASLPPASYPLWVQTFTTRSGCWRSSGSA